MGSVRRAALRGLRTGNGLLILLAVIYIGRTRVKNNVGI